MLLKPPCILCHTYECKDSFIFILDVKKIFLTSSLIFWLFPYRCWFKLRLQKVDGSLKTFTIRNIARTTFHIWQYFRNNICSILYESDLLSFSMFMKNQIWLLPKWNRIWINTFKLKAIYAFIEVVKCLAEIK